MHKKTVFIAQAAVIAALYTVLGSFAFIPIGPFQLRFGEALTVLPFFTPAAIPGLFVGCILSNVITGCSPWDIAFGSIATLLGAVGTYLLRNSKWWFASIPPIIANTLILPPIFTLIYGDGTYWFNLFTTFVGEILACGIIGTLLVMLLKKYGKQINFRSKTEKHKTKEENQEQKKEAEQE